MYDTTKWINENRVLLTSYECKYVAITDRIIATADHLADVANEAEKKGSNFVIYYVPKGVNSVRIRPIHK